MAQLQNTQTLALQLERVRDKLELLYERTDMLWGMIKEETDVDPVSTRNMRIPVQALAGGIPSQVNPDGGDFGRGSGTTFDFGQISPVYISIAVEVSKLAEIATNGGEKAIESIAKVEPANAMKQLNKVMDNLLNTDGSGTLDSLVTATSATQWTVNNANQFMDNMLIDVWSALGGAKRGTVQVLSVDPNSNILYLAGAGLGTGVAGDLLLLSGAPGVAGGSLLGILYYQTNSNSGNWLQLPRASYPGKLRTPYVNGNSASLTQQTFRRLLNQLAFALGDDIAEQQKLIWYMNLDMAAAWENVGLAVSQVIHNQLGGSSSEDMIKKSMPQTAAGRKIVKSIHAKPGRVDGLCLSHWGRCENQPIDYLEYGGQTVFPIYGGSGGVTGASIFYYWTGVNVFNANPRAGCFADTLAIPVGYFGH